MIAFVVNGGPDSAMAERATSLAKHLAGQWDIEIRFRTTGRLRSAAPLARWLVGRRPSAAWVFDMALAGVAAGACARATGTRLIVDTGDAITALARQAGLRGPAGIAATHVLEWGTPRIADALVVRGTAHRALLSKHGFDATVIPDGVELRLFAVSESRREQLRRELGVQEALVVGLVGSSVWSERLGICYGWDLVEMLGLLPDRRVVGLMIGDGTGVPRLRQRAAELGVQDRLHLVGRQPFAQLPAWLAACDVCLSTQTNDVVGQVRTTGKLPLYMASGRFVLASRVGEAARVLPPEMLVRYDGTVDRSYPARLAQRVAALCADPDRLTLGQSLVPLAQRHFAYDVLARRAHEVLAAVTGTGGAPLPPGKAA